MFYSERNTSPLSEQQVNECIQAWKLLTANGRRIPIDATPARTSHTLTAFNPADGKVYLGADVFPSAEATTANARATHLALLAHEHAHSERHHLKIFRPRNVEDAMLDEAETSIHASFHVVLSPRDREDLIEDARDRLDGWLSRRRKQ